MTDPTFHQKKGWARAHQTGAAPTIGEIDPDAIALLDGTSSPKGPAGPSSLHLGEGKDRVLNLDEIGELELAPPPAARWRYAISSGQLYDNNKPFGAPGYAGTGKGRNNSAMVKEKSVGPLPPGRYSIGAPQHHKKLGPGSMYLDPFPENNIHGRDRFYIHGDNSRNDASEGCIVLPPNIRAAIAKGGGDLEVTLD